MKLRSKIPKKTWPTPVLAALVLCCLVISACTPAGDSPVAASVDGRDITRGEFQAQAAFMGLGTDPKVLERDLRVEVLEALIRQQLILAQAHKMGISLAPEVLAREEESLRRGLGADAFARALAAQGIGFDQWRLILGRDLLVKKTLDLVLAAKVKVTAEQVRHYYQEHRQDFQRPAQVFALHAVLPTKTLAQELVNRVRGGEDMASAAFELGAPLEEGGEPIWLSSGHMPPALEKKIFALKPGKLAGPLTSPYGYHVVKVLKTRAPASASLAQAADDIQKRLSTGRMEELAEKWIEDLRETAQVKVSKDFINNG